VETGECEPTDSSPIASSDISNKIFFLLIGTHGRNRRGIGGQERKIKEKDKKGRKEIRKGKGKEEKEIRKGNKKNKTEIRKKKRKVKKSKQAENRTARVPSARLSNRA
jgi:hypothetical protein